MLFSHAAHAWITLDATAQAIWRRFEYPASVAAVTTALAAHYEAAEDDIRSDVEGAVAKLLEHGLLQEQPAGAASPLRDRYLSLLKSALANTLYPELELQIRHLEHGVGALSGPELLRYQRDIGERMPDALSILMAGKRNGMASARFAHTMIGLFRLTNIERCAEAVIRQNIPGDFLEAGVCKGGAAIFMRALQIAHGAAQRKTWVVDSFEGVPPSDQPADRGYDLHLEEARLPWLACGEAAVRDHFSRYDLLDANVEFVRGWVAQSLPDAPIGPLAILRIDVDLYSSTMECLDLLYDKVSPGGYVIVDDYGLLQCCRDAVDQFRARRGLADSIQWIDSSGIYWRKSGAAAGLPS
jgi:O-methyltransferase